MSSSIETKSFALQYHHQTNRLNFEAIRKEQILFTSITYENLNIWKTNFSSSETFHFSSFKSAKFHSVFHSQMIGLHQQKRSEHLLNEAINNTQMFFVFSHALVATDRGRTQKYFLNDSIEKMLNIFNCDEPLSRFVYQSSRCNVTV